MFTVSASPALTTRLPLIIVRTDALIILMLIKPPLHILKNFPFISWKNLQCNTLNLISWLGLLYLYTKYSIGSSLAALKSEETWHRVKLGLYTTRPTNENQVLVLNIDSHRKTSVCFNKNIDFVLHWSVADLLFYGEIFLLPLEVIFFYRLFLQKRHN